MIGAAAAYLSGLFFASFITGIKAIVLLVCAGGVVFICGKRRGFRTADYLCIIIFFGMALTANRLYTVFCYDRIMAYGTQAGDFEGEIIDFDIYSGDSAAYIIDGKIDGVQKAKILFYSQELDAGYGDVISLKECSFERIKGDYLFDSESYYRSRNIPLKAARYSDISVTLTNTRKLRNAAAAVRNRFISRFRQLMGSDAGGFMSGMIFGEKQYLDSGIRDILYRSGIGHILAVSGLHVSIAAAAIMAVMRKAGVNRFIAFGVINVFFLLIITMANYPISAVRAVLMLEIMYSAPLFRRQGDSFNSLAITALAICLAQPWAVYSSGFVLSVSGTFGIAVFGPYMVGKIKEEGIAASLKKAAVTAVCTSLATAPAMLCYFDEISLISLLSNIIIVPLCSLAMLIGMVFVLTGGVITPLLVPAKVLINIVLTVTKAVSSVSIFRMPRLSGAMASLMTAGFIAALCVYFYSPGRRNVAAAITAFTAVFAAIFAYTKISAANSFTMTFLGKERGGVVVVSCHDSVAAADLSGHYKNPEYAAKYMAERGVDGIDSLILTKNVQSLYASYMAEIGSIPVSAVCTNGSKVGNSQVFYGETAIDAGSFSIRAEESRLEIGFGEKIFTVDDSGIYQDKVLIMPFSAEEEPMCNFELILSPEGIIQVRSL